MVLNDTTGDKGFHICVGSIPLVAFLPKISPSSLDGYEDVLACSLT